MPNVGVATVCWLLVAAAACSRATPPAHLSSKPRALLHASEPISSAPAPDPFADLTIDPALCDAPARATITREEALADVATVERILRRGYAGFDVLASRGLDWDDLFAAARADVSRWPDTLRTTELRDALVRWLAPAADNHLAVFDNAGFYRSTGVHQRGWVADVAVEQRGDAHVLDGGDENGARLESCAGHELRELLAPFVDARLRVRLRPLVLSVGAPPALSCRIVRRDGKAAQVELGLHRVRSGTDRSSRAYEALGGSVPRLRIRDLGAHEAELEPMVASAAALRKEPAIVVDVRGNDGGSDRPVTRMFGALTHGELRYNTIDALTSEVTLQGALNLVACSDRRGEAQEWAKELATAARAELSRAKSQGKPFRRVHTYTNIARGTADVPFRGALVLLTDNDCASSCETFVLYTKQVSGGVHVGQNTAGTGVFGEARSYRLPKSGLGLQAGIKWFRNAVPGLDPAEGRGYLPDLWIDSDESAAVAEKIAACLSDPKCAPKLRSAGAL